MDKKTLIDTGFFIDNEYLDKMLEIIKNPDISGKTEVHHILPVSIGGKDTEDNLITVSVRQHFYIHYYLTFCTQGKPKMKMNYAFKMMAFTRDQWRSLKDSELQSIADYYTRMVEEGCFKNNYERTPDVKKKISDTLKARSKLIKCIWVNNGINEKYIPENDATELLNNDWTRGRLPFSKERIEKTRQATLKAKQRMKDEDAKTGYVSLKNIHGTKTHPMTNDEKVEIFKKYVNEGYKNHKIMVSLDGVNFVLMSFFDIRESGLNYLPKYAFLNAR